MKNERLKSLTWKYFWEQKIKESARAILILAILGIYYFIVDYINCKFPTFFGAIEESTCHSIYENIGYMFLLAFGLMIIGAILFITGYAIYKFIKYNWEKAEKRAQEELEE